MSRFLTDSGKNALFLHLRKEYEHAASEMRAYLRQDDEVPEQIRDQYFNKIGDYQKFLDKNGYKMPLPIWKYEEHDKSTWKFLDVIIGTKGENKFVKRVILNPAFKLHTAKE